jgi:hypothetical protein
MGDKSYLYSSSSHYKRPYCLEVAIQKPATTFLFMSAPEKAKEE